MKQNTSQILMIAPSNFGFNEEAFKSNKFQNRPLSSEHAEIQSKALLEFKAFVEQLERLDVDVLVYSDVENSKTPDSIFPNNWISTHESGLLITYPMAVSNRRTERRDDIVSDLIEHYGYQKVDYSQKEILDKPQYLEGTGSMIFDHQNKIVYAAISPRTDKELLQEVAEKLSYTPISFKSYGKTGELIYHTNVMMCIADKYVMIGTETIDEKDKENVIQHLQENKKEIIELDSDQVYNHFAGNMLQIENKKGESVLVMSQTAYSSLISDQLEKLNDLNDHILAVKIPTIEKIGGGSARCMLAELFIPQG